MGNQEIVVNSFILWGYLQRLLEMLNRCLITSLSDQELGKRHLGLNINRLDLECPLVMLRGFGKLIVANVKFPYFYIRSGVKGADLNFSLEFLQGFLTASRRIQVEDHAPEAIVCLRQLGIHFDDSSIFFCCLRELLLSLKGLCKDLTVLVGIRSFFQHLLNNISPQLAVKSGCEIKHSRVIGIKLTQILNCGQPFLLVTEPKIALSQELSRERAHCGIGL